MKKIIYADDELNVIYQAGSSDFLLVVFGDLVHLTSNDKFYAEPVVTKLAINTICFTATTPNWFPALNVGAGYAACITEKIISEHNKIVIFGASMGGYAAIKYSKLLKATHVLAYCPQYSIDPAECDSHPSGYEAYYTDNLKDMGIKLDDLLEQPENIYIVYDPEYELDNFHFSKIVEQDPRIHGLKFRSANHELPKVLSGTSKFYDIISSVLNSDHTRLVKTLADIRRPHPIRIYILLTKLIWKHPQWAVDIFEKNYTILLKLNTVELNFTTLFKTLFNHVYFLRRPRSITRLGYVIQSQSIQLQPPVQALSTTVQHEKKQRLHSGQAHSSAPFFELTTLSEPDGATGVETSQPVQPLDFFKLDQWITTPHVLVKTFHDSILCLDLAFMQLTHQNSELIHSHPFRFIPLYLGYFQAHYCLIIFYQQQYNRCCLLSDDRTIRLIPLNWEEAPEALGYQVDLQQEQDYFHLTSLYSQLSCGANPDGEILWDRPFTYAWETFYLNNTLLEINKMSS